MSYQVSIEIFEGPLDLLLHLIHKQKLDIYDIPIAQITQQYLDYIKTMQQLDIELASEFVVMAATLLSIKAKMLLPRKKVELETEGKEEDPRQELAERLAEYEKFKKLANKLKEMEQGQSALYFRPVDELLLEKALKKVNPLENVTLTDLCKAFKKVLKKASAIEKTRELERAQFTIGDKIKELTKMLESQPQGMIFQELFSYDTTRLEMVITFLALLELIKLQKVVVQQETNFGPLQVFLKKPAVLEGEVCAV